MSKTYAKTGFSHVNTVFVDYSLELTGPLEKGLVLDLGTRPARTKRIFSLKSTPMASPGF